MQEAEVSNHPSQRRQALFQAAAVPVWRASTVIFDTMAELDQQQGSAMQGVARASVYATNGTPSTFVLAEEIAQREAGEGHRCALLPSGLTAVSAALHAYLHSGDHLLMVDCVYGPARALAMQSLSALGIEVTFFPASISPQGFESLFKPNTRAIFLESPGSYTLEFQDIPALSEVAHRHGALVMLDNTWASPCLLRPMEKGVDVSIIALTKYWNGHSDLVMGAVVVAEVHWMPLFRWVRLHGLCVSADDATLVMRGARTVEARVRAHEASGLALAQRLKAHPMVKRVFHPAFEDHPGHQIWRRDYLGSNGLFSFELIPTTDAAVLRLVDRRRLFKIGYSWGGFESLIMPARLTGLRSFSIEAQGPLIRVHVGLEPFDALLDDLMDGLRAIENA